MKKILTPQDIYGQLFEDVQQSKIFLDSKIFADAVPTIAPDEIMSLYQDTKHSLSFDLNQFVRKYFVLKEAHDDNYKTKPEHNPIDHINELWGVLFRHVDIHKDGTSLIFLNRPYIVPGGRFNEIYYWDSYFTMLGLRDSGDDDNWDFIDDMIINFKDLINRVGYIPNGNRSYYLGRSQPPFFSSMVKLLADLDGDSIYEEFLEQLLIEHHFWMKPTDHNHNSRCIKFNDGKVLNHYNDNIGAPRMESYSEDMELVEGLGDKLKTKRWFDLRAACESGWDFSSRWLANSCSLDTIQTRVILPIELNCLLFHLEKTIAKAYRYLNNTKDAQLWKNKSKKRARDINDLFWCKKDKIYKDYNTKTQKHSEVLSLATMYPLFFKIASKSQAKKVAKQIESKFLKPGGVVTTLIHSGQQWDAPNGWAPLQWITVKGLLHYGYDELAAEISKRWLSLNDRVFYRTGKFLEKYNVEDLSLEAGGGEYPVQDGFGWSNGVYLALKKLDL